MRVPAWLWIAAGAIFAVGIVLRYAYIFHWHPPGEYLYSDMQGYLEYAQRYLDPEHQPDIRETVFPPGTGWYLGTLLKLDRSFRAFYISQFLLACLVPVVLAGLAADLFGRRVALGVLAFASLYWPFIDYFGYLLSEGPLLFFFSSAMWLLVRALRSKRERASVPCAFLAGLAGGLACIFKSTALPAIALAGLLLLGLNFAYRLGAGKLLAATAVGLLLILAPLAVRNTRLSEGRFCLIANQTGSNFLLGHYGRCGLIHFYDRERNYHFAFGSPSAAQRGYTEEHTFNHGVYENGPLMRIAWGWIREHPVDAFLLSLEHVSDLFFYVRSWPSSEHDETRPWVRLFQFVFLLGVLLPALYHLFGKLGPLCRGRPQAWSELLLLAPIVALMITAFLFVGEPRYRIPFDGMLMILAMRALAGSKDEDRLLADLSEGIEPSASGEAAIMPAQENG